MSRKNYTPEFKTKLVLEVLQGEKELNKIASENNVNPNMLRNWKKHFMENASSVFDNAKEAKKARRKEKSMKKENDRMLKTIGQVTLERDFLQDCFRECGLEVPKLDQDE